VLSSLGLPYPAVSLSLFLSSLYLSSRVVVMSCLCVSFYCVVLVFVFPCLRRLCVFVFFWRVGFYLDSYLVSFCLSALGHVSSRWRKPFVSELFKCVRVFIPRSPRRTPYKYTITLSKIFIFTFLSKPLCKYTEPLSHRFVCLFVHIHTKPQSNRFVFLSVRICLSFCCVLPSSLPFVFVYLLLSGFIMSRFFFFFL
jgi:hypothetical protein